VRLTQSARPAPRPRRTRIGGVLLAVPLAATLIAGCAGTSRVGAGTSPAADASSPANASPAAASPAAASPAAAATAGPSPAGAPPGVIAIPLPSAHLHQTRAFPGARTSVFRAEMTDLWAAVVTGQPALGMPAFFPLRAYRQVKAIADPTADWHDRLVADYRLDVGAAHALLGRGARHARLVRVIVPSAQAAWINPGVCANGVGYWHVAGARVLYRQNGRLRSIGIASLISWRGLWYVVHFGAVLRTTDGGVVDQPSLGAGTTGPAGGC
jgi:hypothetical protein